MPGRAVILCDGERFILGEFKGEGCWIRKRPGKPPRPYLRGCDVDGVRRYLLANGGVSR